MKKNDAHMTTMDDFEQDVRDFVSPYSTNDGVSTASMTTRGTQRPSQASNYEYGFERSNRSKVWTFFTKHRASESAICNLCDVVIANKRGSTTGMRSHLKFLHQKEFGAFFSTANVGTNPTNDDETSTENNGESCTNHLYESVNDNGVRCLFCGIVVLFEEFPLHLRTDHEEASNLAKSFKLASVEEKRNIISRLRGLSLQVSSNFVKFEEGDDECEDNYEGCTLNQPALEKTLLTGIAEEGSTMKTADTTVIFLADGARIRCHKMILASLSELLFQALEDIAAIVDEDAVIIVVEDLDDGGGSGGGNFKSFMDKIYFGGEIKDGEFSDTIRLFGFDRRPNFAKYPRQKWQSMMKDQVKSELEDDFYGLCEEDPDYNPLSVTTSSEDDDDIEEEDFRQNNSVVWKYFEINSETMDLYTCKLCDFVCKKKNNSDTSHMLNHLNLMHSKEIAFKEVNVDDIEILNDYFTIDVNAVCKICEAHILNEAVGDCEAFVQTLIDHLKHHHPEKFVELRKKSHKPQEVKPNNSGRPSAVWLFYRRLDADKIVEGAECNLCSRIISTTSGSTTGLIKHLKSFHGLQFGQMTRIKKIRSDLEKRTEPVTSLTWAFYEIVKDGNNEVKGKCRLCDLENFPEAEMLTHLRENHAEAYQEYEALEKDGSVKKEFKSRMKRSAIWGYFLNKSPDFNTCKECGKDISCKGQNTSNMIRHLEHNHQYKYHEFVQCSELAAEENQNRKIKDLENPPQIRSNGRREKKKRSPIWNFFVRSESVDTNCCKACGKEVSCKGQNTSNMIRHLEFHHVDTFLEFLHSSNLSTSQAQLSNSKRRPKVDSFSKDPSHRSCPECGKVFSCRPAMLYHRKVVHSGIRPFICGECGMSFARHDSFKSHTHSTSRPFLCTMCGKTFARKSIRDVHERAHRGDKRYPCTFCPKKFMTNQQKTNHERTHTGEKPFQCTHCGRQFAQSHQLHTHLRIHTGEKPYNCKYCMQAFRHLSSRNNHKCDKNMGRK